VKGPGLISLVFRNLWRRPGRNGILIVCVAVVVGLEVAAALIDRASRRGVELGIERLGADLVAVPYGLDQAVADSYLTGEPALFYMDSALADRIASFEFVERTSAQVYLKSLTGASCCSTWNVFLIGFEPDRDFTVRPWLRQHLERPLGPDEVLVGSALFSEPGAAMMFYGHEFTVAGGLAPTGTGLDSTVFIPLATARLMARESRVKAEKPLELDDDRISAVMIKLKPEAEGGLPGYRAAYQLEMAIPEISVIQPDDLLLRVHKNLGATLKLLRAAGYAVWPAIALLIGLVFVMAARERQRELGLLRGLGATRSFIFRMIMLEALLVAALGTGLGLLASAGLVSGFSRLISKTLAIPFFMPAVSELTLVFAAASALALLTAALAALLPSLQASLMEPYEAIRRGE